VLELIAQGLSNKAIREQLVAPNVQSSTTSPASSPSSVCRQAVANIGAFCGRGVPAG